MNPTPQQPDPFELQGRTVLIVDDEPANLEALSASLEGAVLQVLVAQTGERGLNGARRAHPDLILLDVRLPDLDLEHGDIPLHLSVQDIPTRPAENDATL